jgi:hypothetical protein
LPSKVFGTGADMLTLPSVVRGTPGTLKLTHCAGSGGIRKRIAAHKKRNELATVAWVRKAPAECFLPGIAFVISVKRI